MPALRTHALLLTLLTLGLPSLAKAQGYDPSQNEAQGYQALNDAGVAVDPPGRVARVSVLLGNVSVEPASVNQFSAAESNYPMTTGDRIYADQAANAELQTGQLALRLGQLTDLTVTAMTDALAQFGLAQGSVHLRSFGLYQGETVELDTPGVAVTVLQPGDVRIDVDPNAGTTLVTLFSGAVDVEGSGLSQQLSPGQSLLVTGTNPPYGQFVGRPRADGGARGDGLDRFSADRDNLYQSSIAQESQYLDPATIGAEDLATSGDWETDSDIGPVWYPSGVAVGWQPYVYGHWTWIAPWGWTWVENEPWGFAPFHYGRWLQRGNRWGWVPGPPTIRPIYSPALVVFVGGTGSGISAWFPLGPREVYTPWYHASTVYVNRVNVTNIYNRNTVEVRNTYNQRIINVYANAGQQNFANRSNATVAVSQASFAAGRPVAQSMVRVDPRQLAAAPVLPHPVVSPERSMVVGPPARAVPPVQARPVLTTHNGYVPTIGGPSNIRTGQPAQQPAGGAPMPRPGQQIVRAPVVTPSEPQQPAGGVAMPRPVQGVVRAPFDTPAESQPVAPAPGRPAFTPQGPRATDPQPMQPRPIQIPRTGPQDAESQPARPQPNAVPQQPAPQQLYNRAVPPEPRPSFDQQRQAIESTDPGRPLSPQQLNNVRQSAPAGPAQRPEAPHPAPAAAPMRSTPAPASPSRPAQQPPSDRRH